MKNALDTRWNLRRHWSIFSVLLVEVMHFRLRALVWIGVGSVNTLILLLFWIATLNASGQSTSLTNIPTMVSYYLLMVAFASLTICHIEEEIAYRDINKGTIERYLLRPYPYLVIKFLEEIVWRFLGSFWSFLILFGLAQMGLQLGIAGEWQIWLVTILSMTLGVLVSYFWKVMIGLASIWITNIRGLMELSDILSIIFSGFIIPLHLFPESLRTAVLLSPFAAPVYYPVSIVTKNTQEFSPLFFVTVQLLWVVVMALAANWFFRKGIKHYTGVSQ